MKEFKQFLTRKTRADGVNEKESTILAVAGKGGVGKSSIAAVMVKLLVKEYPNKKILAIDADPAVGLATALGVEVSLTIDNIRKNVVEAAEEGSAQPELEAVRFRCTFDAIRLEKVRDLHAGTFETMPIKVAEHVVKRTGAILAKAIKGE